ncbi:MAG: hypothetical protein ACREJI_03395, partial [Candidatus Methylomirabilales bacterium]
PTPRPDRFLWWTGTPPKRMPEPCGNLTCPHCIHYAVKVCQASLRLAHEKDPIRYYGVITLLTGIQGS